ncbi:hypothetical protein HYW58_02050 [Candidatus Kaiserbacteria bacterium]|nr:hypothetical protein [Candidatus Kaiserbacteria bacterium]
MNERVQIEIAQEKRANKQSDVEAAAGWVIWTIIYVLILLWGIVITITTGSWEDFGNKNAVNPKT